MLATTKDTDSSEKFQLARAHFEQSRFFPNRPLIPVLRTLLCRSARDKVLKAGANPTGLCEENLYYAGRRQDWRRGTQE
jgi:hypothetical protein